MIDALVTWLSVVRGNQNPAALERIEIAHQSLGPSGPYQRMILWPLTLSSPSPHSGNLFLL